MPLPPRPLSFLALALTLIVVAALDAQDTTGPRRYCAATGAVCPTSTSSRSTPRSTRPTTARPRHRQPHKVAADALDGRLLGDPANLAVSEDGRTVYVVNHHGAIDNASFRQHGGRGQIAALDVDALLEPQ